MLNVYSLTHRTILLWKSSWFDIDNLWTNRRFGFDFLDIENSPVQMCDSFTSLLIFRSTWSFFTILYFAFEPYEVNSLDHVFLACGDVSFRERWEHSNLTFNISNWYVIFWFVKGLNMTSKYCVLVNFFVQNLFHHFFSFRYFMFSFSSLFLGLLVGLGKTNKKK